MMWVVASGPYTYKNIQVLLEKRRNYHDAPIPQHSPYYRLPCVAQVFTFQCSLLSMFVMLCEPS